jgi:dihydrodipicolinate synthase/N-acetylneuraminate lyase
VVSAGFVEPSPAGWKAALHAACQIPTPALRPPMSRASTEVTERLLGAINAVA